MLLKFLELYIININNNPDLNTNIFYKSFIYNYFAHALFLEIIII